MIGVKRTWNSRRVLTAKLKFFRSVPEAGDGGAQVCLVRVPEFHDQRMPLQRLLHDAALDAFAAAVNQADLAQSGLVRRVHVFFDHRLDVARGERV